MAVADLLLADLAFARARLEAAQLLDHDPPQPRTVLLLKHGAQPRRERDQRRPRRDQRVVPRHRQLVERQLRGRERARAPTARAADHRAVPRILALAGRHPRRPRERVRRPSRRADHGAVPAIAGSAASGGADHRAIAIGRERIAAQRTRPRIAHSSSTRSGTSPDTCTATPPDCSISRQSSLLALISKYNIPDRNGI